MKYFQPEEYRCRCGRADCPAPKELSEEMQTRLDELRRQLRRPVVLNSALRCPEQTKAVGGVEGSEHGSGDGVDIAAPTSGERFEILYRALPLFSRIGVGKTFIHVGTGPKPAHAQNVVWLYS